MTLLNEVLDRKLKVQENGKARLITGREAIVIRVFNAALKGDPKALTFILGIEPEITPIKRQIRLNIFDAKPPWQAP
jgi:hypothetical protein